MGNFQTDRVIQILLPLFQGLSGQPVYQVDAYVLDAVFFAKPDCAQSLFAVMAPVQETAGCGGRRRIPVSYRQDWLPA